MRTLATRRNARKVRYTDIILFSRGQDPHRAEIIILTQLTQYSYSPPIPYDLSFLIPSRREVTTSVDMPRSDQIEAPQFFSLAAQLSPSVYLYQQRTDDPSSTTSRETVLPTTKLPTSISTYPHGPSPQHPQLVVLAGWMSAHPRHLSKYAIGYQKLYPSSSILLIRCSPSDMILWPTRVQRQWITPAVSAILSRCTPGNVGSPQVLLHIFSNGGSHQACNLLNAYRDITSLPFPGHVTIFDSCPGRASIQSSVLALSSALPAFPPLRGFLYLLIYMVCCLYWVIYVPLRFVDQIERIRRALCDPVLMSSEKCRCYLYSGDDRMVNSYDVEAHALEARKRGFNVGTEKFEGSGHCAHMMVGEGIRYWAIVSELWQAGQQ